MRGLQKYLEFHGQEPRKIGRFHARFEIPERAAFVGEAQRVMYRSDKLNPGNGRDEGWIDYFHNHDAGVHLFRCDRDADGPARVVPAWLRDTRELTWLGHFLGLVYIDHDGKTVDGSPAKPFPELFCIPSGRALLVVQSRRKLLCLLWGGRLGVEQRGIVH